MLESAGSCWSSPSGGGSQLLGPLRRAAPRGVERLAGAERLGWSAQRESAQPAASAHPNRAQMPDDLKVSSLMDHSSKKWNEELVRICFGPADAECILNIALSHNQVLDCVSWPLTKTGTYTVKSAYILAKSGEVHLKASATGKRESSDQLCNAKEWKRLWSIKAPPKMRIVLWRFAHNCLPTGQQLRLRNITSYDLCCHCGRYESIEHAFLTCQYLAEV